MNSFSTFKKRQEILKEFKVIDIDTSLPVKEIKYFLCY
jgi:hypothetical protein